MREYRARMNGEKREEMQKKNSEQQKNSRVKWDKNRINKEKIESRLRMRKSRLLRKERVEGIAQSPEKAFGSAQSFGKAVRRVGKALPNSPRKQLAVVKKLAVKFNLPTKLSTSTQQKVLSSDDKTIVNYYKSDSISRQMPGMKDYVTVRHNGEKERVQKKPLMEAFRLFKQENPSIKVQKSKFANLRPKEVLPISEKDHTVCCCIYHENFDMLIAGISKHVPNLPSSEGVLEKAACRFEKDCYFGDCTSCCNMDDVVEDLLENCIIPEEISDECWVDDKKIQISKSKENAKVELVNQIVIMKKHVYIAKIQLRAIKELKTKLDVTEGILQEDFAENFNIKYQNEIMTAHWSSNGVTLFTAVFNSKDGYSSHVMVSNDLHHDKYSVATFNRIIANEMLEKHPEIEKIHIFSDGAGSQFKNKYTLVNMLRADAIHENIKSIDWSFFGTAHGKGPVDGVGGTVKRAVWRRILQNRVLVNSAEDFANVAKECCPHINVTFVDKDHIAAMKKEMGDFWIENSPQPIPNIRKCHYFKRISSSQMVVGDVSPFTDGTVVNQSLVTIYGSNVNPVDVPKPNSIVMNVARVSLNIQLETYYAVDYVDRFYIGRVLSPGTKQGFWKMKFFHKYLEDGVPHFIWPKTDDIEEVHTSIIFWGPVTLNGCIDFTLPKHELKRINECFVGLPK
ncbi:hypothetical protein LOTGIDRAFT_163120 [Lottia gigantea]|uniref:Uncharacterized protein n=1 Tax=Lottia gigantea TaxID=225164 RepID=V4A4X4_LOTGI|nr:hypothetical protein LOTGIDRAFT_163120 [Lottia gigantea]ESO91762.1 hypothetical protein LOTGIDRAFT_163120 [Lottia gigantea]